MRFTSQEAIACTHAITDRAGVVTWDVPFTPRGHISADAFERLRAIGDTVKPGWNIVCGKRSEPQVLMDLAGHLYPAQEQFIAECFYALKGTNPAKVAALAARLEDLIERGRLGQPSLFARKLFPNHRAVAQALALQLRLRAAQEWLIQGIVSATDKDRCVKLLQTYFDAYLAWDTKPDWHALWGWNPWRSSLFSSTPRFVALVAKLGRAFGSPAEALVSLNRIRAALVAKYGQEPAVDGCLAPLESAFCFEKIRGDFLVSMAANWTRSYRAAAKVPASAWTMLALKPFANRALVGRDAWICSGHQLKQLGAGVHRIHGVPFRVIEQERNAGRVAIMLKPPMMPVNGGRPAPDSVAIPVNRACRAVYVLHGAGFAAKREKAAEYRFVYEDGAVATREIWTLGSFVKDRRKMAKLRQTSAIQDWWPTAVHFENAHARRVIVAQRGHAPEHRVLYTLEWLNPHPKKRLTEIQLQSMPGVSAVLLVVSITVCSTT